MINMDEASWKLIDCHPQTVAIRRIEGFKALFSSDPKSCLTVIVSMSATGSRLPKCVIG
jgi:hypothetical protein